MTSFMQFACFAPIKKQFLTYAKNCFKWSGRLDLPSGKISDEIFLQAGLAVLAFAKWQNSYNAAPFKSRRRQSSLPASPQ